MQGKDHSEQGEERIGFLASAGWSGRGRGWARGEEGVHLDGVEGGGEVLVVARVDKEAQHARGELEVALLVDEDHVAVTAELPGAFQSLQFGACYRNEESGLNCLRTGGLTANEPPMIATTGRFFCLASGVLITSLRDARG